ncbi:MAG: hypothetical protein KG012_13970 [Deltaproteobacteria bacterium]|nr:hypothetical protein [Deltaproteobacteria bacterium]
MKKTISIAWLILFFVSIAWISWAQEKGEAPPEWKVGDKWVYKDQNDRQITFT